MTEQQAWLQQHLEDPHATFLSSYDAGSYYRGYNKDVTSYEIVASHDTILCHLLYTLFKYFP
jgi:hypothetical protein